MSNDPHRGVEAFAFTADWSPAGVRHLRRDVSRFWPAFWIAAWAIGWLVAGSFAVLTGDSTPLAANCCVSYLVVFPIIALIQRSVLRGGRGFVEAMKPLSGTVDGIIDGRTMFVRGDAAMIGWTLRSGPDRMEYPTHDEYRTQQTSQTFPVPHHPRHRPDQAFIEAVDDGDRTALLRWACRWFDHSGTPPTPEPTATPTTPPAAGGRWTLGSGQLQSAERRHPRWFAVDAVTIVVAATLIAWASHDRLVAFSPLFAAGSRPAAGDREIILLMIGVKVLAGTFLVLWTGVRMHRRRQPLGPYDVAAADDAVIIMDPDGVLFGYRGSALGDIRRDEIGWRLEGVRRWVRGTDRFRIPARWFDAKDPDQLWTGLRRTADADDRLDAGMRSARSSVEGFFGPSLPKWE